MKDSIFNDETLEAKDFVFDQKVVSVFDDMVTRSVPYYLEMQRMVAELANEFALPNTNIYDLGCSTGTTMLNLDKVIAETIGFVGVDNSAEMLAQCEINLKNENIKRELVYSNQDLNVDVELDNPSVVIFCLTLQFLRPKNRERILRKICDSLPENGAIIIVEKILAENAITNRLFIDYYYNFKKRNGYSETEIAKKREALENVLIPYKISENWELLQDCGFSKVETFFKWYNFAGLIAIK